MKSYILAAVTLLGMFHCGSSADILEGHLVFHDDSKCVGVNDAGEPTSVTIDNSNFSECALLVVYDASVANTYMVADDSDRANHRLTLPDTQGAATLGSTGTKLQFSRGGTAISGITEEDATAITDMASPFLISNSEASTDTVCLGSDLNYIISSDASACDNMMWYFKLMTCTDEQCTTCNLGPGMCSACSDMYGLDANKACVACTTLNENCKSCALNNEATPVLECSGCNDMYALKADKTCEACTEADENCMTCAYNSETTPALECSGCKSGYNLKDSDKSCEKDDDENNGVMQTASALVVMVTSILALLQMYN